MARRVCVTDAADHRLAIQFSWRSIPGFGNFSDAVVKHSGIIADLCGWPPLTGTLDFL
jgi:hypothetical protein